MPEPTVMSYSAGTSSCRTGEQWQRVSGAASCAGENVEPSVKSHSVGVQRLREG